MKTELEKAKKMHERNIENFETQTRVNKRLGKEQPEFFEGVELDGKFYTMSVLITNTMPSVIKEDHYFDFDLGETEYKILEEYYTLKEFTKLWNNDEY